MKDIVFLHCFIHKLLANALVIQIHINCTMSVFCTSPPNFFGHSFLID